VLAIGCDVGGTHTDAVLLDGRSFRGAAKVPTTEDVTGGILAALRVIGPRAFGYDLDDLHPLARHLSRPLAPGVTPVGAGVTLPGQIVMRTGCFRSM
jgi:hypothetical protein